MKNVILNGAALLTGNWLSQERQRLGKTRAEVVKAVRVHSATLRSVEHQNRVLPPGWYPALRELGMQFQEPVWPAQMAPYTGADLNRDLRTCSGLQPSRFWLSKQLCIAESVVGEVVRGNLPVPHSWLLKLAELGANVPAPVRTALHPPVSEIQNLGPAAALRPALDVARRRRRPAGGGASDAWAAGDRPSASSHPPLRRLPRAARAGLRGLAAPTAARSVCGRWRPSRRAASNWDPDRDAEVVARRTHQVVSVTCAAPSCSQEDGNLSGWPWALPATYCSAAQPCRVPAACDLTGNRLSGHAKVSLSAPIIVEVESSA